MNKSSLTKVLAILLVISLAANAYMSYKLFISGGDTADNSFYDTAESTEESIESAEAESVEKIDNTEYEAVETIHIYLEAEISQSMYDYIPSSYGAWYQISINKDTNMAGFSYYGFNYDPGNVTHTNDTAQAQFSGDIFYEIKDMLYKNQISPYEFPTDENGKRIDKVEPTYVMISYEYDGIHVKYIGIKKPDNMDEIVTRLNELVQIAKE